jgi:hypothetical protein
MENKDNDNGNNKNINKKKAILFLHGFTQNSDIFLMRTKVIIKIFKTNFPNHQMIVPDAPHIINSEQVYLIIIL